MLYYLCDLMEDTNDFSWASAKASHAVLLCELERGTVDWSNTSRIDRIRSSHAQRVIPVVVGKIGFQTKTLIGNHGIASHIRQLRAHTPQTMSIMAKHRDIFARIA